MDQNLFSDPDHLCSNVELTTFGTMNVDAKDQDVSLSI